MSNFRIRFSLWSVAICCLLIYVPAFAQCQSEFDFHEQPIGTTSTAQSYPEINPTTLPTFGPPTPMTITSVTVNDPADTPPCVGNLTNDYTVGGTCVAGLVVMPGDSCTISVNFTPQALGPRNAIVTLRSNIDTRDIELRGTGVTSDFTRPTKPVVEYVNASLNEYVITSAPAEIAALDAGALKGWVRTGASFNGFQRDPFLASVCRWYAVTASSDTHWYFFNGPIKCGWYAASVYASRLVEFVQEDPDVFDIIGPSFFGWCPYATIPLYGLYDRIIGHRYTIDPTIRADMIAQDWLPEGYGPGVVACVSQ